MRRILGILALVATASVALVAQPSYDLVIRNARIVDGSGNPWYRGDVAIRGGRIAAIGRLDGAGAARLVDAQGGIVAPGFIDIHTHADGSLTDSPAADNYVLDGVTTLVGGNCGGSPTDLPAFFAELRGKGISVNFATLVGHNSVRRAVLGTEPRDPTPEELARMEGLVEEAMRQGAFGFSTGLIYVPGTYAKTSEVVALARAAARRGGLYASHIRNEGDGVLDAIAEALQVGREAGMPVEISHFKVAGKQNWGRSANTIALVERARAEGLDVTVDQYPYTASSTNLGTQLPSWALAGGQAELVKRLDDPATRRKIADEMKRSNQRAKRKHLDHAVVASCRWDASLNGKSITAITRERGRKAKLDAEIQTVLDMMAKGGAQMVYHTMDEGDVERIMRYPYTMVGSDSGVLQLGDGQPHPRGYGSNARILGRYVRERKVLRLEEAVRKMTSLPAQRLGLSDRGLLRPGMWADLVVFDDRRVADRATFDKPHAYPDGFRLVVVNGEIVAEDGRHTGARPGQVLLGPAAPARQTDRTR
jgi:N-acyl-D-amino-acid deacylase